MQTLSLDILKRIAGGKPSQKQIDNMNSILLGLEIYGPEAGLTTRPRLAQFVAQLAHESGRFVFDREVWGPTPAQNRYEGRKDLGNTQAGDGSLFRGHGPIQVTGRHNTTRFWQWAKAHFNDVPNFVTNPALINIDPWEGLSAVWYWHVGNPDGQSLNRYADEGNIEMVTRKVNGGLNGFADRCALYTRAGLVLLGYELKEGAIARFQKDAGIKVDDIDGPDTRRALHLVMGELDKQQSGRPVVEPVPPPPAAAKSAADYLNDIQVALDGLRALGA